MSILKSKAEQAAAQHPAIVKHYRAIGPAAILAAVLAAKKRKQPQLTVAAAKA